MTAIGNINAGGRILASALRGIAPLAVVKSADESVTSSTTLQNDDELLLAVSANSTYIFVCVPMYLATVAGTNDVKFTLTVPSGASINWFLTHYGGGGTLFLEQQNASASTYTLFGSASERAALAVGSTVIGSTAGTLQVQWAQAVSSGTATTMKAGSLIAAWQIA